MIILDFSGGNICKNYIVTVRRMIDELKAVDTGKHQIIIKWQLFTDAPPNIPLQLDVFDYAYWYAEQQGYQTTASVFDLDSLKYLLCYDVPFVKIANRPDLYWLAGEVPRKIPVYMSVSGECVDEDLEGATAADRYLMCVSKYPATVRDYVKEFHLKKPIAPHTMPWLWGISDHTTGFELLHKYKPSFIEWHYRLADSTGPDAGDFARTATMLAEIL